MAFNDDQNEYPLPAGNNVIRTSAEFLPRYFRTNANKKFLASTLDQLTTPGVVEKINAYVGRREAKAVAIDDNYLPAVTAERENYQLEPFAIKTDNIGNVIFNKDYSDYIGILNSFRSNVENHSHLNSQEFYAWDPHIDFDKFTNFREYYWLPNGPQEIPVKGQSKAITSTYKVTTVTDDDNTAFLFTPNGKTRNPILKLYRGQTYRFEVECPGHPFGLSISRASNPTNPIDSSLISTVYNDGITITHNEDPTLVSISDFVSEGFVENGVLEFTIPDNAPDTLYYVSQYNIEASGSFAIYDIEDNTEIDVENEILDKKTYTTSDGWKFSNGMKVYFQGDVTPAEYAEGFWYVEGVGERIMLVAANDLEVPAIFTQDTLVPFDSQGFDRVPYSDALSYAGTKDYIVMNRKDPARNAWARYNRWFHKSVVEQSATINNQPNNIDESARAKRPIIEFEPGLRLFNHGTNRKSNVDLVDTFTKDVFSTIEGSSGYNIDGIDIVDGMRILFTADTDSFVNGKIFEVNFITHNNSYQISLVETADTDPVEDETILIRNGDINAGRMYWYNGTEWKLAQDKTGVNQAPLFDLYDINGNSISDTDVYPTNNFTGNRLFSYRVGSGNNDTELGFPLSYKNIENIGDIVFDFDLLNKEYSYEYLNSVETISSDVLYLRKYNAEGFSYVNAWTKTNTKSKQFVIRKFTGEEQVNSFPIDVFDYSANLTDLEVRVYLNNKFMIQNKDYSFVNQNKTRYIVMTTDISETDILIIKAHSNTSKNQNGYYEIPYNFERNPLNENITEFTLGQVSDHVEGLVAELPDYTGVQPGSSNLRDLGPLAKYGRKFLQHSGPVNLPLYHLTDRTSNIIKSLRYSKKEYAKFKRAFLQKSTETGFHGPVKQHVDHLLIEMNKYKTDRMPFYSSDMLAYGAAKRLEYVVLDYRDQYYSLTTPFNLNKLSRKAVNVYLNSEQLIYNKDYTFTDAGFVYITATLANDDLIEIYEYENTEASFVPPTPTSFGLYPAYQPEIFVDTSYETPTKVIRGHDGSLIVAYDDYRDDLILEFEKRIYNNIKVQYNTDIFDIYDFIPGNFRKSTVNKADIDNIMITDFIDWLQYAGTPLYTDNSFVTQGVTKTYNYSASTSPTGIQLPGFWRGVFKQAYDTDRPHTHPWEMLGFASMPTWWETQYGPAPYTSDNLVLWQDLEEGIIREPGKVVVRNKKFIRPGLTSHIPVNEYGQLLSPLESSYARNFSFIVSKKIPFAFGDEAPTETAWRRSSEYPFALLTALVLLRPAQVMGLAFDRSRIQRDVAGNLSYTETNKRIKLNDLVFPNTKINSTYYTTAGLVNYISEYMKSNVSSNYSDYINNLTTITNNIGFKLGGYAEKEKLKLVLDSRTPLNKGNVFVPDENYNLILRSSSPLEVVSYSGVIIEKTSIGYKITGYDNEDPFFKYNPVKRINSDPSVNVGGISESFISWAEDSNYVAGKIVKYEQVYYRVNTNHKSGNSFDPIYYSKLAELPVVGGVSAIFSKKFYDQVEILHYNTILKTIQDVVDFLLGYENYLINLGFTFDYVNVETEALENFRLVSKEFMFWTTQNWAVGSLIRLSPAANQLTFNKQYYVVDNVFDSFYDYSILRADGSKLNNSFVNVFRDNLNVFSLKPINTDDGIYFIKLPLLQKEHAVIIDNETVFNDTIYAPTTGYRQERLKVVGYRVDGWNGSLNIPGFVYDQSLVTEWKSWKDYSIGDIVKYKEFYYSARFKHTGKETFDSTDWYVLSEKPTSSLKPNFDYRANQFADFYDLDSDNFDSEQQRLAQHLIGYQKRQYLENIINDDVSQYKFYQGMIQDKGTNNALTKLFDKLGSANQDSLNFYEEWAIRTGQYGAIDSFEEVEYQLDETQFRIEPQLVDLVQSVDNTKTDLVYQYPTSKVYLAPENYTHTPFPTKFTTEEYTKTGGYVKLDQINIISKTINDILSIGVDAINIGDYVWVPSFRQSWNVYKHILADFRIQLVEKTNLGFRATFDKKVNFTIGQIVGLSNVDPNIDGFYVVRNVNQNKVDFWTDTSITENEINLSDSTLGIVSILHTRRFDDLSKINQSLKVYDIDTNERIWVDDNGSGKFEVFDNIPVFDLQQEILNAQGSVYDVDFGSILDTNDSNTIMAVGNPSVGDNGVVYIYSRTSEVQNYKLTQIIEPEPTLFDSGAGFGSSVAITADGQHMFVGATTASNVKTFYKGEFDPSANYVTGDIVSDRGTLWTALVDVNGDGSSINTLTQDWESTDLIRIDPNGTGSGLVNQGSVHIFRKQNDSSYTLIDEIVSPIPVSNGQFGSAIKTAITSSVQYRAYIRSSNDTGRVYFLESYDKNKFRYTRDTNYKGSFNTSVNYIIGEIVYKDGALFEAIQNVFAGGAEIPGLSNSWEQLSDYIDYVGFVPSFGDVLDEDSDSAGLGSATDIGRTFDVSKTGDVLIISGYMPASNEFRVSIYRKNTAGRYELRQWIDPEAFEEAFGYSSAISDDGQYIAISSILNDSTGIDNGKVYIYKYNTSVPLSQRSFELVQEIYAPLGNKNERFGKALDFSNNRLAILSVNGKVVVDTIFDNATTEFDNNATGFVDVVENVNQVYMFENINGNWIYAEKLKYLKDIKDGRNINIKLSRNHLLFGIPGLTEGSNTGIITEFRCGRNDVAWTTNSVAKDFVDVDKMKGVFLYDKNTSDLITYLDYVDPIQGKIPGPAEQEISYKLYYDPAVYNIGSTDTGSESPWGQEQVGKLWWNLSTVKWFNPYQGNIDYQSVNWNKILPGFSVDVYEWVETDLLPSEWDDITDTTEGLAQGVSGTTLYSDNSYVRSSVYDSITGTFVEKYYYWVRNSKVIPDVANRKISCSSIINLITDPAAQGYRFVSLFDNKTFALHNIKNLIQEKNTILHFEYDVIDIDETNIHTEYQLLTEGLATSKPNSDVVKKWIDSLVGYDGNSNPIPNTSISIARRYGILNEPNQSMFVNKTEAVKQIVERVNDVLKNNLIVDDFNISALSSKDEPPSIYSRKWDVRIASNSLLRFVGTARTEQAILSPVISDGKIISVNITNPGRGYIDPAYTGTGTRLGPNVEITGSGYGAQVQTYINNLGQITSVKVLKQGKNYNDSTSLIVRPFTALIDSDDNNGGFWAVYSYFKSSKEWNKMYVQNYDTSLYWEYTDWYAPGYDITTAINYSIPGSYALDGLNNSLGSIVKIENIGTGGWLLLKKVDNQAEVDYTVNYETIGRQNGTIQLSQLLYQNSESGFDNSVYDAYLYDREPVQELRIIMETLRDNIFVDQLEVEWNKLFFASVRYAMSEQNNLDWIFKTSFVKAKHNVGELDQRITFRNDNLSNYQDYVNEVKPYSTKVREYISAYESVDPTQTSVTDFDLPPRYDFVAKKIIGESIKVIDNELVGLNEFTLTYPQKHWYDNVGFEIKEIVISEAGSGYNDRANVTISGGGGPTLTGYATVAAGKVTSIEVDTKNATYLSAPTIRIEGSLDTDGTEARAIAIIGYSKTRSTHMLIKFDRTSGNYLFTVLDETETFTGNGGSTEFNLIYPLDTKRASVKVYVDDVLQLSSDYTVTNNLDLSKGYRRYLGQVIFAEAPATGAEIVIEYKKSAEMMHAADRINFFYNPTTGMLGKDLGQLMDGIDYGGVQLDTVSFANSKGFDAADGVGFGAEPFDTYDTTYEDLIFVLDGSTQVIELGTVLEAGVVYNIYKNNVRVDDPFWDGSSVTANPNAIMASITGDGISTTFYIDNDVMETAANDVIVIRKSTSDGSFTPDATSYDVDLTGGNFQYTTAKGIDSGDIVVDGDGFVTETTSKGPEENVPGQLYDTLDLKVYNRVPDGQGIITSHNYTTDGETFEWNIERLPQAQSSVIVKIDNVIQDPSSYEIDYLNKKLAFTDSTIVSAGKHLNVTLIGNNGIDILDIDQFTADGVKQIFNTNIAYDTTSTYSAFVTIDGIINLSYELINENNSVAISFAALPQRNSIINYTIYNGNVNQYSQLVIDNTFVSDGVNATHYFGTDSNPIPLPFVKKPIAPNILVETASRILNPGWSAKYTLTIERAYDIAGWQFPDTTQISIHDVLVYINGARIFKNDFTWDPVNSRIQLLKNNVGLPGDVMEVFIIKDAEYFFIDTVVKLSNVSELQAFDEGSTLELKLTDDSTTAIGIIKSVERTPILGDNTRDEVSITINGYVREFADILSTDNSPAVVFQDGSSVDTFDYTDRDDSTQVLLDDVYYTESEQLTFAVPPVTDSNTKIYIFSNHDINEFERVLYNVVFYSDAAPEGTQEYIDKNLLSRGYITLRESTTSAEYVWIAVDGLLLNPNADYKLINPTTILLLQKPTAGRKIDVLQFAAPIASPKYGYRIFKDMLNRTHYKRLNKDNQYKLAENLNYYDLSIVLEDATGIAEPNRAVGNPGVIWIDNERIEYYAKDGNLLRQLRRGTLGTGIKLQHVKGTLVEGQGPEENIPYKDETYTTVFTGDGSTDTFVLDFDAWGIATDHKTTTGTSTTIEEIAVDLFDVFVAGRRLRNHDIDVYDVGIDQDSPEADYTIPAEFTVDSDNILHLTNTPAENIKIQIVRKIGKTWHDPNESLSNSNTQIARFIRDKTISLAR